MTSVDWLWLLHPALAVALVFPLLGAVLQLAIQTRRRRLNPGKAPASSGSEHTALGRWLTSSVVAIQLIAYAVVILTQKPSQLDGMRSALLLLVLTGSVLALVALWRVRQASYRASFALLCWIGVIGLGMQPEIWRLSDNPLDPAFWQSHFWGGMGLTGLLLFSLAALIFLAQGITGPRDLLEIPLSWQKATIWSCDFSLRTCPPLAPPG